MSPQRTNNLTISKGNPSVCFVAPHAYAVLSGRTDLNHFGGAQIQQVLIARELARRGHEVSFVTLDHGQPDGIEHDGIRVYKMCSSFDGVAGLRFIHPRWTSIWQAMSRANAKVYYQRGAGAETGQVAIWCQCHSRPFFFAAASDTNCEVSLPDLKTWRERLLYRYGLRFATRVICQTDVQDKRFRRLFGVRTKLIRSCSQDPVKGFIVKRIFPLTSEPRMLWVGRLSPKKRFEWLLDLAELCPDMMFDVVANISTTARYACKLIARAKSITNIHLHGHVPHQEIGRFYSKAAMLLCTSPVEGFPNTFMEAWAHGTPTATTVDPDRVVARNRLGVVARTVPELKEAIRPLLTSPNIWLDCSARARKFFVQNHSIEKAVGTYESVLMEVS